MKKYPKYKTSGVEWIGDIPEKWEVKKLKYIVNNPLKYGANEAAEEENHAHPRYIRITDFDNNGKLSSDTFKSLSPEIAQPYLLQEGDLLFARSGATVGKTFQFKNYKGKACFAGYLIKACFDENYISSDYINYFTQSSFYENWKHSIVQQATIQNIGADKYNQLLISLPKTISEQTQIANYLDYKTNEIETLISNKQKLIELLQEERTATINHAVTKGINPKVKLKPSDIEWLGDIPEHWWLVPVKRLIEVRDGTHDTPDYVQGGKNCYPLITSKDFEGDEINFSNAKMISEEDYISISKRSGVKSGDVLMSMIGGNIGKSLIVGDKDDFSIKNVALFITRGNSLMAKYLKYYFESGLLNRQIELKSRGGAQGFLSLGDIRNLLFFKFDNEELIQIVNFLDVKISGINTIITKTEQEIELLKEYKTVLISEVVTGKVDVRDEKII